MSETPHRSKTSLAELRERLVHAEGPSYWRGLDEIAETEEFVEYLHREFPEQASELHDPVSRRRFLQLMGASLALAGATACGGQAPEKIVPYVRQPENMLPGKPRYYASATLLGGYATGVLVESHMGRPTKVEGNPEHPASLGSSDSIMQASLLEFYDPDRSQVVLRNGRISAWPSFLATFSAAAALMRSGDGGGLRILTPTVTSPTVLDQLGQIAREFPGSRWHSYEPLGTGTARTGTQRAFGAPHDVHYDFAAARVVVTLDADAMGPGPATVRHTRDLAAPRRVRSDAREMSRIYAIESTPTTIGAIADHRWRIRPDQVESLARALAERVGVAGQVDARSARQAFADLHTGVADDWLDALADDLRANAGAGVVVAGDRQPAAVHALAHAINSALGNIGTTVLVSGSDAGSDTDQPASLAELVADMNAGTVPMLLILGGNPAYDAPADLEFTAALQNVPTRVHVGLYDDETAEHCHWHVPAAHAFESWGDARSYDGTVTFMQPLIEPLYGGRSVSEILAILLGQGDLGARDLMRLYWSREWAADGTDFERRWQRAVHDGVLPDSRPATLVPALRDDWDRGPGAVAGSGLVASFRADETVYDGRFANNGWLQETPKPLSKLTWDNAALISPATAESLGVANYDVVDLELAGRSVRAPIWILPGQADDTVTLPLGYGRRRAGRIGTGIGFDAYALRTTVAMDFATGLTVSPTGARQRLASTQLHHSMEGRDLVRVGALDEFRDTGEIHHPHTHVPGPEESLYEPYVYEGHSWAMTIDLNVCTGCNGCVTACQAENNIPIVGKEQVANGREMHWIRIDRYWSGSLDEPQTVFQPVTCMHCENAPCEVVCPVAATVHGSEGLNEMVYNRCVGTRYCANNCPYKVRRFNFLDYTDTSDTPVLAMLQNPDVTVRSRGVMEKCTYCVQRINVARQDAKIDGREMQDGDVVTACQQACPAQAITFGDINDPESEITRARAEPLHYGLLEDLGTRPRTNYLAKLRNPNPTIHDVAGGADEH